MEVPDLYHASCQTLLTIWGLPLPPALPVLGLHVTVAGLNKRVSTTHYTQKSRGNLFYAYFAGERLVICWHPDHFEFSFCSIPHRSLIIIRIWSSGGLSCFYCEYLSLIDIPSVFVILVVVRVWGREVCPVFLFSLFAPLWSSVAYLVFVFVCVC